MTMPPPPGTTALAQGPAKWHQRWKSCREPAKTATLTADACKPVELAATHRTFTQVLEQNLGPNNRVSGTRMPDEEREARYQRHDFVLIPLPFAKMRVWPAAGGLPRDWTEKWSVADLARNINGRPDSEIPPRLGELLSFLTQSGDLSVAVAQLATIPAVALPEFHQDRLKASFDPAMWSLDDGSHRAVALAMLGYTHLWCFAGVPRYPARAPSEAAINNNIKTSLQLDGSDSSIDTFIERVRRAIQTRISGPSGAAAAGSDNPDADYNVNLESAGVLIHRALADRGIVTTANDSNACSALADVALTMLVQRWANAHLPESKRHSDRPTIPDRQLISLLGHHTIGADLARLTAQAARLAADSDQLHSDWSRMQQDASEGIQVLLPAMSIDKPDLADLLTLILLLNRIGVSHRTRFADGPWRIEQSVLYHQAAVSLLARSRRPRPNQASSMPRDAYMLASFTTLANLASAWVESAQISYDSDDTVVATDQLERARIVLTALRDGGHDRASREKAHKAMHGVSNCLVGTCLPPAMLSIDIKNDPEYASWDWTLSNDLAEIHWRITFMALMTPKYRARRGLAPMDALRWSIEFHERALKALGDSTAGSADAVARRFWLYQHRHNLSHKLQWLRKTVDGAVATKDGQELVKRYLAARTGFDLVTEIERCAADDSGSKPPKPLATLDAYYPAAL